jgi:hypothetical protein
VLFVSGHAGRRLPALVAEFAVVAVDLFGDHGVKSTGRRFRGPGARRPCRGCP